MKPAFLFPGQGSQQAGMGEDLLADPELSALCDECSQAAGVNLRHLLLEADEEELRLTQNAQPALCFTSLALLRLLQRRGVHPAATAGHSVGEYPALAAAGALDEVSALRAVVARGQAMAGAVPAGESSMSAVIGLGAAEIEAALAGLDDVWPANYNTPTQVVVGGRTATLPHAEERLRAAGARRVIPLNVSAAFHTPLMRPAAVRLRSALDALPWQPPHLPAISNVSAQPYPAAAQIPELLELQLFSPVRWGECVQQLLALGCDAFLEVGPRKALAGMMRELAPGARVLQAGSAKAVQELELSAASGIE